MVKAFNAIVKNLYFTVAPVMIKAFAVFVVVCISANVFVPKFAIDAKDYSTLCQIAKSRPILFEFFSLSVLPVKILSEFFNEQHNGLAASHKKAPKGCTNNVSNNSPDFLMMASARFSSLFGAAFGCGNTFAVFTRNFSGLPVAKSGNPPGVPPVTLIFLMFYFMKARSALPEAGNVLLTGINKPRLVSASRDFSLLVQSKIPQKNVQSGQQVIPLTEQDFPLRSERQFSSMYLGQIIALSASC